MDANLQHRALSRFPWAICWAIALILLSNAGCSVLGPKSQWYSAERIEPGPTLAGVDESLGTAESCYQTGLQAESAGDPVCIDHYFAAATAAWPQYVTTATAADDHATVLYRSAVQSFVESAVRFGRFQRKIGRAHV